AVPRSRRDQLRLRPPDTPQGARAVEEGAAAESGRTVAPARGGARAKARLLDPRRSVAARRARAVCARDLVGRDARAPGLLPPGGGVAADRRARRRPGGPQPPALGPALVHALVRAARGAGSAGAALRTDGRARLVTELPPFEIGYPRTELER